MLIDPRFRGDDNMLLANKLRQIDGKICRTQVREREKKMVGKSRILLVDDEPAIVEVFSKRLQLEGYELLTAIDGEAALAKARQEKPDLIIADIMILTIPTTMVTQTRATISLISMKSNI